ncbi:MAG: hypothetical protein ACWA5A_18100 [Marinibacterium sp.]
MKRLLVVPLVLALSGLAGQAGAAECYADYKAKRGNPLELHYGVTRLSGACSAKAARREIAGRLAADGWTLLNVVSVFGPEGLDRRRANAGAYFLRY